MLTTLTIDDWKNVMKARYRRFYKIFIFIAVLLACNLSESAEEGDPQVVNSVGFLDAHPDLRWRRAGELAYRRAQYNEAFRNFLDSARYADKASQAMIAEMLWKGEGVSLDRPRAYAWMDLAAERGYSELVALREHYWLELSADERKRAIEIGGFVYAEFSDTVAKHRMENELVRARIAITGSHLGHLGSVLVPGSVDQHGVPGSVMDDQGFGHITDGANYFAPRYWNPDAYWRWQDQQWKRSNYGRVDVGPPLAIGNHR